MKKNGRCPSGQYYCYTDKKCKPIPQGFKAVGRAGYLRKENGHSVDDEPENGNGNGNSNGSDGGGVSESKSGDSSLRDWFGKSKSSDGKPGWVQLGGKYAGKPCAKQPGQTTKPKCGSSKMKRNLSKDEEQAAFRRKNVKDPNPNRKGKAINVKTEEFTTLPLQVEIPNNIRDFNLGLMFRESLDINSGMLFIFDEVADQSFHMTETKIPLDIAFITEEGIIESIKQLEPYEESPIASDGEVICALEVNRGWFAENNVEVGDEIDIDEAAGEKDACYHKVKSRYSVWPSAYASGALVKCRKVGAKNWGNKSKKEEFELDTSGSELDEACWKGYEKKGMKTMFGKRYPNCVKKTKKEEVELIDEKKGCNHTHEGEDCPVHGMSPCDKPRGGDGGKPGPDKNYVKPMSEAVRIPSKTGNIIMTSLNWRGRYYGLRMFFPSTKIPTRAEVQIEVDKVYPGARVQSYKTADYVPGQPLLQVAEGAAWTKKSGKNKEGGLNEKGRRSYEKENPGSDLKAPSKKVGNPRRASFCARMKGMRKRQKPSNNTGDDRLSKSLRKWNC